MSLYRGYFVQNWVDYLGSKVVKVKDQFSVIFVDDLDCGNGMSCASGEQILTKARTWADQIPGCVMKSTGSVEKGCNSIFQFHQDYGLADRTQCVDFMAVFDHGNSKIGQWAGNKYIDEYPGWSKDICGMLCENAKVFLLGCGVGKTKFPQRLADICRKNIKVYACPDYCRGWGQPDNDSIVCLDGILEFKPGMAPVMAGGRHPTSWNELLKAVGPVGCSRKGSAVPQYIE